MVFVSGAGLGLLVDASCACERLRRVLQRNMGEARLEGRETLAIAQIERNRIDSRDKQTLKLAVLKKKPPATK